MIYMRWQTNYSLVGGSQINGMRHVYVNHAANYYSDDNY